jgi:3'-5' exonuclease
MLIYIDVETVPSMHPQAKDEIRASIRPPATYKKADSIATWYATEADAAAEEQWRRQALDGGTNGQLISVAVCDDSERQWVRCIQPGESEAELLRDAFATVEAWTAADAQAMLPGRSENFPCDDHHPVAHNAAFDLGFLWRRATVHGVPRPRWLPGPMARPGKDYTCTMQMWSGFGKTVSLDMLCRALGVPSPKGELDGSKILDTWLSGQYQQIQKYNLADAIAVREVYHRLTGWRATA